MAALKTLLFDHPGMTIVVLWLLVALAAALVIGRMIDDPADEDER